jgi:hypothetical protein
MLDAPAPDLPGAGLRTPPRVQHHTRKCFQVFEESGNPYLRTLKELSVAGKGSNSPVLPLHHLTVRVSDGMAIAELALADKGPPTTTTVAFRPGAFAILWIGERLCVSLVKRRDKFQRRYLDMMGCC